MAEVYDVFFLGTASMDREVQLTDAYLAMLDTPCYAVCVNGEPATMGWEELRTAAAEARERVASYCDRGAARLAAIGLTLEEYRQRRATHGRRSSLESIGRCSPGRWAEIVAELAAATP
jgi:hypothetical protein